MAGGKRAKGARMRSARPVGFPTIPRLSLSFRTMGRPYWFERFQRGLELRTAIDQAMGISVLQASQLHQVLTYRQGLLSDPLLRDAVSSGYGEQWQSYAGALDDLPAPDWQAVAVVEIYQEYEDLVRKEFYELKPNIRQEFINEASGSKEKPFAQRLGNISGLAGLKYAIRASRRPSDNRERLGLLYYQWMRPFYYNAGIDKPVKALNEIQDTPVKFLGKNRGLAHKNLADVMQKAEEILQRMGKWQVQVVTDSITRAFAFVPRPQNEFHKLSNHALGRALDINAKTNPHIQGNKATEIDEVLTYLNVKDGYSKAFVKEDLAGMPHVEALVLYLKMTAISNAIRAFLKKHLETWEKLKGQKKNDVTDALLESQPYVYVGKLVHGLGGTARSRIARDEGVFTISGLLFQAFKEAGAELNLNAHSGTDLTPHSGVEWKTEKDPMHWEVKNSKPLQSDQKGRVLVRDRMSFAKWYIRNA